MKDKNWFLVFLVFVLVVATSSQSLAWWGAKDKGDKPPEKGEARFEKIIAEKLELTDEQKEKFKANKEQMKKEIQPILEKIKGIAEKLKEEMKKDSPNRTTAHGYITEINDLRTQIQIKRMDGMLDLYESLTPEQKEKFKEVFHNRKAPKFGKPPKHQ